MKEKLGMFSLLKNPQERVKLLKAGITRKTIERLYIAGNDSKIVNSPVFLELIEIDIETNKNIVISREEAEQLLM